MSQDPRDPAYDPKDDPKVLNVADAAEAGDLPNELPPETQTITFHQRLERNATLLLAGSFAVVMAS